jgi:hypothetical protein
MSNTLAAFVPLVDYVMACRFGYYCHATSYVPDAQYDEMEREARKEADFDHPIHDVGSSNLDDYVHYPSHIRALSLYLRLRALGDSRPCPQCHKPAALGDHSACNLQEAPSKKAPPGRVPNPAYKKATHELDPATGFILPRKPADDGNLF